MKNYEITIQFDRVTTKVSVITNEEITENDYDLAKEIAFDALWNMADVKEVCKRE